jgi:hypothetical protein
MNWYDINWIFKDNYLANIGERWDQISYNVYGRPDLYYIILQANDLLSTENRTGLTVQTTTTLKIPDIDLGAIPEFNLPTWRILANVN